MSETLSPTRRATHRLARALRVASDLAMRSNAAAEDIEAAAAAVEAVNERLAALPLGRALEPGVNGFDENSPMHGPANPLAPPLHLQSADGRLTGTARFSLAFQGPPGSVHGGYVAAAFDDFLGQVMLSAPVTGPTAALTVWLRRGTPIERDLRIEAWVDRIEGRKVWTRGAIYDGDILTAEGEALFIGSRQAAEGK